MTREETIKVLAILKAAYPNSYKGMTKEEANGTIMVWATQFANIPAQIVMIAVNKHISASPYVPAVCEIRDIIKGLYYEACDMLNAHELATKGLKMNDDDPDEEPILYGTPLDAQTLATVNEIIRVTSSMRGDYGKAVKLSEMLGNGGGRMLESPDK